MKCTFVLLLGLALANYTNAQKYAITCDGEKVLLNADGTWKKADGIGNSMPSGSAKARYKIKNKYEVEVLKEGKLIEIIRYSIGRDWNYNYFIDVEGQKFYVVSKKDNFILTSSTGEVSKLIDNHEETIINAALSYYVRTFY